MGDGSVKDVIEAIVKALVDDPDEVVVKEIDGDATTVPS
jgi:predicted RNA-binding protein YlqC (UPF0109 family)